MKRLPMPICMLFFVPAVLAAQAPDAPTWSRILAKHFNVVTGKLK